jgi:hypothetical protein
MVWFFLARVSVYAVTNKAELEVDRAAHPVESAVSGRVVAVAMDGAGNEFLIHCPFDLAAPTCCHITSQSFS